MGAASLPALLCGLPPQPASHVVHKQTEVVSVIFTAAPMYESLAALDGKERFPQGAQLMVLRDGRTQALVPELAASADASVSFDAKSVLFAGKKHASDPWGI
jgi:hypothetical protein